MALWNTPPNGGCQVKTTTYRLTAKNVPPDLAQRVAKAHVGAIRDVAQAQRAERTAYQRHLAGKQDIDPGNDAPKQGKEGK